MALQHIWLNELTQKGSTNIDLIITDDTDVIPSYRVTKSFPIDTDREAMAQREKQLVIDMWNNQQVLP